MSDINFVKGECRRCAGHLEFDAAAVGEAIACPHCGQRTELIASVSPGKINGSRSKRLVIAAVVLVALSGLTAEFFLEKKTAAGQFQKPRPLRQHHQMLQVCQSLHRPRSQNRRSSSARMILPSRPSSWKKRPAARWFM